MGQLEKNLWFALGLLAAAAQPNTAWAQATSRHHANWVFGVGCQLGWDAAGTATFGTNPVINTGEGVATWSDPATGALVLFTDGISAWNGSNTLISSGSLGGDPSAAQSGLIIPVPGATNEFYIATQPANIGSARWTRFDMRTAPGAQVGTPAVIPGTSGSGEMLGVTAHSNGRDFWLVALESNATNNRVLVMPVTDSGIGAATAYDVPRTTLVAGGLGQIAFSSTGDLVAFPGSDGAGGALLLVGRFDRCTGAFALERSYPVPRPSVTTAGGANLLYGVAWSPDDSQLYVQYYVPGPAVFQVTRATGVTTELGNTVNFYGGGLSLAVDGRIYAGSFNFSTRTSHLGVIASPNAAGTSAGFSATGLAAPTGCNPRYGLPTAFNAFALPTGGGITLGVGIDAVVTGSTATPSGTTTARDGDVVTVTVTGPGGFSRMCTGTVAGGEWACAAGSITGLTPGTTYTAVARVASACTTASASTMFTTSRCGDGLVNGSEACDDGNASSGDGCGASCALECGFVCLDPGRACTPGGFAVQCVSGDRSLRNNCGFIAYANDGSGVRVVSAVREAGQERHLDGIAVAPNGDYLGFVSDVAGAFAAGSHLARIDPSRGIATRIGPDLGLFVTGAAVNRAGQLWVTVADEDTSLTTTSFELRLARVDTSTGAFIGSPVVITRGGAPVLGAFKHPTDILFRSDDSMVVVQAADVMDVAYPAGTVTAVRTIAGSIALAGTTFFPDGRILGVEINGEDELFTYDPADPSPSMGQTLLYADPIPENSGSGDAGSCTPAPRCGDGVVNSGEACDDGDNDAGDGCSATCTVESGWGCAGSPSACYPSPTITTPAEGSVTASTTPAITGTCTAGSTVTLRQGAGTVCTATCAAAGTYSCTPTTPLTPGAQMITASQTIGGVTPPASPVRNFTVLGAPSITTPTEGAVTSSTPAISGACVAGAAVTVREGTATVCTATCSSTGTYTCTPSAPLSTGPHMIVATQVLSGATSPTSPVRTFSVAACMDTSSTGMDMGCSAATPYCVGTGAAASCVACTMASHCNDSNACTADSCSAAGACVFTAIAAGSPGMCAAGLVCSGAPSNMCVAPIPTIVTPAEGSSTTDTTPDITGACVAGATVTIREGTATVCTATCSSTGTYTCTPSAPMTLGGHMLTATQVVGGSMSGASPVRNFSIVTCLDSATGAGTDSGCSMTSPICVGAGTSMARCQPCQDSTTGGTDLGCMAAAPACVAGADGTNLCLPCEDSATGNMLDNGCMTASPICLTGEGGARECVECTADTHCGVGRVCNASNECVPGCTTDADCVGTPATPVCDVPNRECAECNVTADCDGTETCEMHECVQPDSDDDGTPDDEDLDDDNDGIPDTRELPTGLAGDADNDGILDFEDPSAQADGFDCMASADGVCTRFPATVDFDGDGIPNHLDLDADGDGILDVIEAGGMAAADGTIAGFADMNGNGLADSVDAMPLPIPNTDGTDGPDFLDLDADGDGIVDSVEGGYTGTIGTDGRPMGEDANDDGVIDTLIGTGQLPTPDFDGDGRRDFQDLDDDNDSIPTEFEAPDANGNGRPDDARDTDGDGRPDYLDVDDDGDGIDTEFEAPDANDDGNPSDARDTDDDSTPDYLDPDDDGDSLDTEDEMSDPNGDGNPDDAVDTDGDGTPDYLDPREIPTDAPRDAGARDAGAGTPDAGPRNGGLSGGACGCTVNTSGSNTGFLAMLGVLGLVVARRRRRNGSETTA